MEVYSEIKPFNQVPKDLSNFKGVILSGSPFSVQDDNALKVDLSEILGRLPVLGISKIMKKIRKLFRQQLAICVKEECL